MVWFQHYIIVLVGKCRVLTVIYKHMTRLLYVREVIIRGFIYSGTMNFNARRTDTCIRNDSTSYFACFKIVGNYSKVWKLNSIETEAQKRLFGRSEILLVKYKQKVFFTCYSKYYEKPIDYI